MLRWNERRPVIKIIYFVFMLVQFFGDKSPRTRDATVTNSHRSTVTLYSVITRHRFHRSSPVTFTVFTGLHRSLSPFSPVFTGHFHRFHRSSSVTFTGFTGLHRSLSPVSPVTFTVFTGLHRSFSPVLPVFTGHFHHSPSPESIAQYDYNIESIGIVGISFD